MHNDDWDSEGGRKLLFQHPDRNILCLTCVHGFKSVKVSLKMSENVECGKRRRTNETIGEQKLKIKTD